MRFILSILLVVLSTCKTARSHQETNVSPDSLESEDQLPGCDDITVGRVYWVRSLNMQMLCAEGGTWKPRQVDPDGKEEYGFGPRSIQ